MIINMPTDKSKELLDKMNTMAELLVPKQVTNINFTKKGSGYTLTWGAPNTYDIKCVGYNIYKCVSDTKPTSFSQYELIGTTTNLTYEISNINVTTFILIASVSKLGNVNQDVSNATMLIPISINFANASWSQIGLLCEYGDPKSYFNIGDTRSISINGTNYNIQIYDFNHDDLADGSGKAKMTLGLANCLSTYYAMNSSNTNVGGWGSCALRTTLQDTIFNQLPSELRALIKTVNKKTSAGNQSYTINTTEDTLFLFSEVELFGTIKYSASGEGTQYPIFTSNSSRIKKQGAAGSACYWWERSPYATSPTGFCLVSNDGSAAMTGSASDAYGVCFGFCI